MAELIGVTSPLYRGRSLKQELLLFDRIAIPGLHDRLLDSGHTLTSDPLSELAADVIWLSDNGVLFDPIIEFQYPFVIPPGVAPAFNQANKYLEMAQGFWRDFESRSRPTESPSLFNAVETAEALQARAFAIIVREQLGLNAVGVTHRPIELSEPDTSSTKHVVLQIVLQELPMPEQATSLEDVMHFRHEAKSNGLVQSLRVWMNEMASGKLTQVEVSDKLEDLISRYERAAKLEKMCRDVGVVETIVTTTAEIAESLVKFKWSSIAKKLFEVRHKQIDLMKAEMSFPGREVAYIVKAQERFGK